MQLVLDDKLVKEARRVGRHQSDLDAVTEALREYVARHQQMRILKLFETIDYDPDYDYKAQRRRA
jgi:hypothetical protein